MAEIVKPCPACGGDLLIRTNSANGSDFLSCSNWAGKGQGCQHTEAVPESYRMRQMGHPELPLFGGGSH